MNEKNLDYLKDNLKFMGFRDVLNEDLEKNVREGRPEFQLRHNEEMYKGRMEATLHFRQSPSTEMYFFNTYVARLTKENGLDRSQQFYLNNGKGVTLKEAYNLLDGRSVLKDLVNKEGEKYKAWVKLDFSKPENNQYSTRQFHEEKYGYNLVNELGKLNLSPLPEEKEKQLLQSLQKGNLQAVNFLKNGKETPLFIEANPQFKSVNVYDGNGHLLNKMEKEPYLNPEGSAKSMNVASPREDSLPTENVKNPVSKNEEKKPGAAEQEKTNTKIEKKVKARHLQKKSGI